MPLDASQVPEDAPDGEAQPKAQAFDGRAYAGTLPGLPGVYRMYDARDRLLYVGKAKDLRKRVSSYFTRPVMEPRTQAMVAQIARMDVSLTPTEAEALVLESRLIKSQRPRYNILLRDGKGYPMLRLTVSDAYPRLFVHRGKPAAGTRDFGPFPSGEAVRHGMNLLQKTFQLRNCEDSVFAHRSRPCLQHFIGRCSAPCVKLIDEASYRAHVDEAAAFLEGRSDAVVQQVVAQMEVASEAQQYERARVLRDRIGQLRQAQARMSVQSASTDRDVVACAVQGEVACVSVLTWRDGHHLGAQTYFPKLPLGATPAQVLGQFLGQAYVDAAVPGEVVLAEEPEDLAAVQAALSAQAGRAVDVRVRVRGERAQQMALAQKNVTEALRSRQASRDVLGARWADLTRLLGLAQAPTRLEAFDISHTQGEAPVAACVVFGTEGPLKAQYRRYNVDGIVKGDDYAAMRQAVERRLRRGVAEQTPLPEVLLIDGGAGQVAEAEAVVAELGLGARVQVVGVSKGPARRPGEETLVRQGRPDLHPGPASPGLQLIQMVRDEAHRFAGAGHRARREKARTGTSALEGIEGVGPTRRRALLTAFGGLQGVKAASVEELGLVPGFSRDLAHRVHQALHPA